MGLEIKSFRALCYNPERFGIDWSDLTCPPYDVIDSDEREDLLASSPYSFVNLTLSSPLEQTIGGDRNYTKVKSLLDTWIETGVLVWDDSEKVYIYRQNYLYHGQEKTRYGFIALLRLPEEKGWVLPHEKTHPGPKEDRFDLLSHTQAILEPIFFLLPDSEGEILSILRAGFESSQKRFYAKDKSGEHFVAGISDGRWINELKNMVYARRALIADGHHRYEVALAYRDFCRSQPDYDPKAWYNYMMVYFSPMTEENITILPIHRRVKGFSIRSEEELMENLGSLFSAQTAGWEDLIALSLGKDSEYTYGLTTDFGLFKISLNSGVDPVEVLSDLSDFSSEYRKLHVVVLHQILMPLLRIEQGEGHIVYEKDISKLKNLTTGEAGFVLRPTSLERIYSVALRGERMPQKSTFFYPKIRSGFVIFYGGKYGEIRASTGNC